MVKIDANISNGKKSVGSSLYDELVSSASDRGLGGLDFYIAGNPEVGKTHLAATLSEFYPQEESIKWPLEKSIWLEDTFWVAADNEAKLGIYEKGMDCDDVDLYSLLNKYDMISCINKITDLVRYAVEEKNKKIIVIDTMSKISDELDVHFSQKDWKDPRQKWGVIKSYLARFKHNMNILPCHVVFLTHIRAANLSDEQQVAREATRMPGLAGKEIAIVGGASTMLRNDASLLGNLTAQYRKKEIVDRKLSFVIEQDIEAKCRLKTSLQGWTEPHLGKVMKHLENVIQPVAKPV